MSSPLSQLTPITPALRRDLRLQRRKLNSFLQQQAAQHCRNQLQRFSRFLHAQHVGVYLDAFGEISTRLIIESCFQRGKKVYLPKICQMNQHLVWVRITASQYRRAQFLPHRLGMLEPLNGRGINIKHLDLLIMPLLACDRTGLRLGMGGGFYDRTLSNHPQKPYRLGLAHEFQYLDTRFQAQAWDQALDALLTPQQLRRFARSH